tara:strand:- start:1 stop:498 length:498 start_codon:yes stop_codon:yes gene_type:complete
MNKFPEPKIIQTPSHLGLFKNPLDIIQTPSHLGLNTNIKPLNIREAMAINRDRKQLTEDFFSNSNQSKLKGQIKRKVKISSLHDEEHMNVVIDTIFMNNTKNPNISFTVKELNDIVLTKGIEQIKSSLLCQQQFLFDRNNIGGFFPNPVMDSNKIDRQLPRSNFI